MLLSNTQIFGRDISTPIGPIEQEARDCPELVRINGVPHASAKLLVSSKCDDHETLIQVTKDKLDATRETAHGGTRA
jgi:hypothetical protein